AGSNPAGIAISAASESSRLQNPFPQGPPLGPRNASTIRFGVVGPTTTQAEYVARARQELASGEPDQLRHYLTRPRRDRRFERVVTAAIRNGKPIPNDQIDRMAGRCGDRLP